MAQWVSRAPPHQTLPAFLDLNGIKNTYAIQCIMLGHEGSFKSNKCILCLFYQLRESFDFLMFRFVYSTEIYHVRLMIQKETSFYIIEFSKKPYWDLTECESDIKNRALDGVSHFKQIWEGDLKTAAKREILHGLDELKIANSTKKIDPRIWPALENRAFNTSINAALRRVKKWLIFFSLAFFCTVKNKKSRNSVVSCRNKDALSHLSQLSDA